MKSLQSIGLALACVFMLAFAGDSQAFDPFPRFNGQQQQRARQPQKIVVEKEKIIIKEVAAPPKVILQPVEALQDYSYRRQAVQIQPVQAFYRVERFSSGYGAQALNQGYSGCSQGSAELRALRAEVRELQQAEVQRLRLEQQRLTAPMQPPK